MTTQKPMPWWRRLHQDEQGLKVLEIVALLAVAAIILAVIRFFWFRIVNWFFIEAGSTSDNWEGSQSG